MADEYYSVPQNPVYNEKTIRKIQDKDPVRASTIVNPVLEQMIENTSAVKRQADAAAAQLKEIKEKGPGAIPMPDGTSLDVVLNRKADLDPATGRVRLAQMPDMDAASYYRVFEPGDWNGDELRIPKSEHKMMPKSPACVCTVRQRVNGHYAVTWGSVGCRTFWDLVSKELVVCGGPFAGDLVVIGPMDTGRETP